SSIGRTRRTRAAAAGSAEATAAEAACAGHAGEVDVEFQGEAAANGLDLIGARREVIASNGPAIFPEQRADVEDAAARAVEVGLVVAREFFDIVIGDHASEVAETDVAAFRGSYERAAPLEQGDALFIDVRTCYLARTTNPNVIGGVGAIAAGAVRAQQVIPAVLVNEVGRFHVDSDIRGLTCGERVAGLGIELENPDRAEVCAVADPELATLIEEGWVDRVGVFRAIRVRDHGVVVEPEVGRLGIEGLGPHHVYVAGVAAGHAAAAGRVGDIVAVAYLDDVRCNAAAGA